MADREAPLTRRAFAADVMLRHLGSMAKRIEGVRAADDVEMVHKMRVATRRLRNAMDLLGGVLPSGRFSKWQKRIRRVTNALGRARDTDVQIIAVQEFLEREKRGDHRLNAVGVERLLLRLRQRRGRVQPDVIRAMDKLESSGVIDQMRETLLAMKVKERLSSNRSAEPTPAGDADAEAPGPRRVSVDAGFIKEARKAITLRMEQMLAYENFVHNPEHVEELHEMRIAAKYLRYTMEAYAPLFADGLEWQIGLARDVQGLLGDIHDADLWLEQLPEFVEAERKRHHAFHGHLRGFKRVEAGVNDFAYDRRVVRASLHGQFVQLWDAAVAEDRWAAIRDSLSGKPDPEPDPESDSSVDVEEPTRPDVHTESES